MKLQSLLLSVFVATSGWGGVAAGQATSPATEAKSHAVLEEVVVTAERRVESLQTTAIAASVLTGDDLLNRGTTFVDQLQFVAPSATVNNFGQGIDFNIRGIGKGEHNTQTGTGVVTYRDAVASFPGYFTQEPYFDIARVEILRGPQGTFAGQNATGGAVFVTTNDPIIDGGHSGYLQGQISNYNGFGVQGAVNLPISDTLAARVAFNGETRDSFYDISGPWWGSDGSLDSGSMRVGLLWEPGESWKVVLKADYHYLDMGAYPADPVNSANDLFDITANADMKALDRFGRVTLQADYAFAGGATLRSVTGYQKGNTAYRGDLDGRDQGYPPPATSRRWGFRDSVDEEVFSQEFNIISADTGRLSWVVGAYYQSNDYYFLPDAFVVDTFDPLGILAAMYVLDGWNRTHNYAGFGQVGFDLTDNLELQIGTRYSYAQTTNDVDVSQYGTPIVAEQSADFSNWSGKVALNWTVNDRNFLYAFVASGYKPGGLNVPVGFGIPAPFTEETVLSYELGWKTATADGRVRAQFNAFYNEYDDFQVIVGYPDLPVFGIELNNPNTTEIYGFEAQVQAIFGAFSMDAGIGVTESKLGAFFATDPRVANATPCNIHTGPVSASCVDLRGNEQTYAPDFTANFGAQYEIALGGGDTVTPRISYGHVANQWATLFQNPARGDLVESRNIWNAQIAWQHGKIVTTLYGTNITDQHYVGAINSGLRFAGPPMQYGLRVLTTF